MSKALVVIPTYNEIDTLPSIVSRVREVSDIDILVVDDNSPDGTGELADQLARSVPGLWTLHRSSKEGLGPAYIAGFRWAFDREYDIVAEMDADGSHDPAELPTLIELLDSGDADLVIGSRWTQGGRVEGWSLLREMISRVGNTYARRGLASSIHDITAGFRAIRISALRALNLDSIASSGYCFQIEVAHRIEAAGGRVVEHPIVFREREAGVSKMNFGIVLEALWLITTWSLARIVNDAVSRISLPTQRS